MTGNTVYVLLKGEVDTLNQKIDDAIVGVFTNGGSVAFENLPALSLDKVGWAYQITDNFTTTSDFVEGAGKDYPAGTFVSIANTGTDASPVLKYNAMLGVIIVDTALSTTSKNAVENRVITLALNTKQNQTLSSPITIDGVEYTTVESALAALLGALPQIVTSQEVQDDWDAVFGDDMPANPNLVITEPTVFDSSDVSIDSL